MKTCISIDLDNYREYQSLVDPGRSVEAVSFYQETVPRWLDLFDRHGVTATFFVIGKDAVEPAHRPVIREIVARGHEVANHSYSHPYWFRKLARPARLAEISDAESAIADVTGERPVGFRAPSCEIDVDTMRLLVERGYLYDSSILPTPLMWAFMVYGKLFVRHSEYQLGELAVAFAPTQPYVPSETTVHRRQRRVASTEAPAIVEIPFSVLPLLRVPFYSTLLRRLGPAFFSTLTGLYGRRRSVLHMIFHLIELAEFDDTPLGAAYQKMPGLSVPMPARERFIEHAVGKLAAAGEAVALRDVARAYRGDGG